MCLDAYIERVHRFVEGTDDDDFALRQGNTSGALHATLQRARSSSRAVVAALGQATAKIHCVSDADSDHTIVDFQTEEAIAQVLHDRQEEFVREIVDFGIEYAQRVRDDHALFVDAFREGRIGSVRSV